MKAPQDQEPRAACWTATRTESAPSFPATPGEQALFCSTVPRRFSIVSWWCSRSRCMSVRPARNLLRWSPQTLRVHSLRSKRF